MRLGKRERLALRAVMQYQRECQARADMVVDHGGKYASVDWSSPKMIGSPKVDWSYKGRNAPRIAKRSAIICG